MIQRSPDPDKLMPHEESHDEYLTYAQVAEWLQLSERTIWTMTKNSELPHVKLGRSVRFSRRAMADWIESQMQGGTDECVTSHETDG